VKLVNKVDMENKSGEYFEAGFEFEVNHLVGENIGVFGRKPRGYEPDKEDFPISYLPFFEIIE
jgi:hypothetical protein